MLDKISGQVRWHVTEKLAYLRHSPKIVFVYDLQREKDHRLGRLMDTVAAQDHHHEVNIENK